MLKNTVPTDKCKTNILPGFVYMEEILTCIGTVQV